MKKLHQIARNIEIETFIKEYLETNYATDVLDEKFHDEFTVRFGGKQKMHYWGSCPNSLAIRWLKKLYDQGILERGRVGIPEHEIGFPNWVYSYTLKNSNR